MKIFSVYVIGIYLAVLWRKRKYTSDKSTGNLQGLFRHHQMAGIQTHGKIEFEKKRREKKMAC